MTHRRTCRTRSASVTKVTSVRDTTLGRRWAGGVAVAALLATAACTSATAGRGVAIDGPPPSTATPTTAAPTTAAPTTAAPTTRPKPTPTPPKTTAPKKTTTMGRCPGAVATIKPTTLHAAVLPHSPNHVPLNAKASGPQPLTVLVHDTYKGVKDAAAFLRKVHYRGGYQNTWSKGTPGRPGRVTEFSTVYEFADSVGSCSFAAWESKNLELKTVKGLPGLAGNTSRVASVKAFSTEFAAVKGRFVIISGSLVYGPTSGAHVSEAIMIQQYGRL
jgi:hypothetical protein